MAAGKWKLYNSAKQKINAGIIDLDGDTLKVALFLSSSNCNTLTHDEYADLTNEHANVNGYTTGGLTVTGNVVTAITSTTMFDIDNLLFTAVGGNITARFAVLYDDTVSGKPLISVCLMDTTPADLTAPSGDSILIAINTNGVYRLTGGDVD